MNREHKQKASARLEKGATIWFDFQAAFPSMAHPFLIKCLQMLGLPRHAINLIRAFYSDSNCCIRVQGNDSPGFKLCSGVGRGCPLAPLLFAVCVGILMRMVGTRICECLIRFFAGDIVAVLVNFDDQAPILEVIVRVRADLQPFPQP